MSDVMTRLISPQCLFNTNKGVTGRFTVDKDSAILEFDKIGKLEIAYDSRSHLPITLGKNLALEGTSSNLCILAPENQNLTTSQEALLSWHNCFGHKNFSFLQ